MQSRTGATAPAAASLAAVGFLAMLGQVVLLRELAVASFGVELIYLLGLGLWLAAGAAGAALVRGAAPGRSPREGAAFLGLAVLLLLEIAFLRGSRHLFGGVPGAYLPLGRQLAAAALGLVPAGALLGWIFRRAARETIAAGGTLAGAYAWESAGGALGSVAATLSLSWGIPNLAMGMACAAAATGAASLFRTARRGSLVLAAILLPLLLASSALDRRMTSWSHPDLVETADTPYGRVTMTRTGGRLAVFENDALAFESEGTEAEAFVHLAALQAPAGARMLVLGGFAADIAAEAGKHGPSRMDCVDANRALHRALVPHLPDAARRALSEAPARTIFADPRRFLAQGRAGSYDLILIAAPEPASGQSNRFYTREFFRLCSARLSPAGVVALRLPSSENFWTPRLLERNGSVHAALRAAFPDVLVIPGSTDIILASRVSLSRDPAVLGDRLRDRGIAGRLITPEHIRYLLTNDRLEGVERLLANASAPPNTDGRPVCYRQAAFLWLERFLPIRDGAGLPGRPLGLGLLGLAGGTLWLARRRPAWRRAGLAAAAGFGGMVLSAAVLLRFQAESGSLYRDIGLLLTGFMLGLAAGAAFAGRAAAARPLPPRRWGASLLGGLAILSFGLALAESAGIPFRLAPAALMLVLAGAVTAGLFGYASCAAPDPGKAVAPLYAADLLGGCIGAVLGGLLLIPLFGIGATAAGTAFLALAALLLL